MKLFKQGMTRSRRIAAAGLAAGSIVLMTLAATSAPAHADELGMATATPSEHLKDGDSVAVSISGFPAGATVVGIECDSRILTTGDNGYCNVTNIAFLTTDANGAAATSFTVHSGAAFASTNGQGVCDAQHDCALVFQTQGLPTATDAIASVYFGDATKTDAGPATRTVKAGKPVKLSVKVTTASGVPTGTVVLKDGAKKLATKTLTESGTASFSAKLAAGKHKLTVHYSGDASYNASQDKVTVTVQKKKTKKR